MSDIDSENEYIWDLLGQQNFIQPDPKIASEGFSGNNIKTDAVTRIPTLKSNKNVKSNFITKKYSGSKPKLSPSDAKSQHTSTTRELSEEEMKGIKLTEELKDIKLKVERAKSNREQLKKIYEDRIKSDPHKDKRHLSFEDLRREYVGSVEFVFLLSLFLFCLSVC